MGASVRKVGVMNQEDNRHCMGRGPTGDPPFPSVPPQALATFSPGRTSDRGLFNFWEHGYLRRRVGRGLFRRSRSSTVGKHWVANVP